jgi:hypothetical protein
MNRWNSILRVFTAEYLGLKPVSPSSPSSDSKRRSDDVLQGVGDVVNGHAADDLVGALPPGHDAMIQVEVEADISALVTSSCRSSAT